MLVGPTGGGKSTIFYLLRRVLHKIMDLQHRACRFNPKAIRAQQMYGEVDPVSQEWTTGVFAAMWAKACNRDNPYNTWITADGAYPGVLTCCGASTPSRRLASVRRAHGWSLVQI